MVADAADRNAGFLRGLAADGILDRLARLDKAGEAGIHAGREACLAAKEAAFAVDGEHDHHRVGAREMLGAAVRTVAPVTTDADHRLRPADGAEAVPLMPAGEASRLRQRAEMLGSDGALDGERAEVDQPDPRLVED